MKNCFVKLTLRIKIVKINKRMSAKTSLSITRKRSFTSMFGSAAGAAAPLDCSCRPLCLSSQLEPEPFGADVIAAAGGLGLDLVAFGSAALTLGFRVALLLGTHLTAPSRTPRGTTRPTRVRRGT